MKQHRCDACEKSFDSAEALAMHNKSKHPEEVKNPLLSSRTKKRIRNWSIFFIIAGLIGWGIVALIPEKVIGDSSAVPSEPIHWHPRLTITINNQKETIPANIGISGVHQPIHTHDSTGTLHYENNRPTLENMRLGFFFEVWGKKFNSTCIFDNCNNDSGTVKMFVNDKENFEFDSYIPKDRDDIRIEYISKEN